ncbi:MAG: hypothetical protein M1836_001181 [Candelina mexicana]|nr:MAG: hypothetical protein M1836_001181 [Candelina mexicana]
MSAPVPVPRALSPYKELGQWEEPLITFTPGTTPRESYFHPSQHGQSTNLHPDSRHEHRPRKLSTKKSDWEIAVELARENSLLDVEDLEAEHPLFREQVLATTFGEAQISSPSQQQHHYHYEFADKSAPWGNHHDAAPREQVRRETESKAEAVSKSMPQEQTSGPSSRQPVGGRNEGYSGHSQRICDDCDTFGQYRFWCNLCCLNLCSKCWDRTAAHRLGRLGPDNIPHEKTDHELAEKIKAVLEPNTTEAQQEALHKKDENTTWFGVVRDPMDEPVFQDYGRYANIMAEGSSGVRSSRYPSLVSFVGQTGAGKSTLIKALIELQYGGRRRFPTPVVGAVNQKVPTSGDVHLYSDPQSYYSTNPVLYADCEGLEGGESEPMGARAKLKEKAGSSRDMYDRRTGSFQKKLRKMHHSSQREITWATTAEKRSRQFAVTHLYPRLLYTFSDTVVFVLRNTKTFENVVGILIEWASAALETSSNQPVLPHTIIALNASENSLDPAEWDVRYATRSLMSSIEEVVARNPKFHHFAQFWRDRGKKIRTVEDLLLSYYSTVRVVRIPTVGRPNLINAQVAKLSSEINSANSVSQCNKRAVRMLLEADELQRYLQFAFDHFACNLDTPFDFVKASFTNNPIPLDFGGNILKLAINIMEVWENRLDGRAIFKELSVMVASCIMLDSARHKTKGSAETILRDHYMVHCDDAIDDFCARHWPCEYASRAGRCVNRRSGHNSKGHQLKNGKVIADGGYQSDFSADTFGDEWRSLIHNNLKHLLERLRDECKNSDSEEQAASDIHRNAVLAYGKSRGKTMVELSSCPLHVDEGEWSPPCLVAFKPPSAGVRILTLDGGGIRGVAELEILRLIEQALGGRIPIQAFFDLIVGTSAGGMIALGLGVENWTVENCIHQFYNLCGSAFTPRRFSSIPVLSQMIESHFNSKYETRPLQRALMNVYSDDYLFGSPTIIDSHPTKVAITAATAAGLKSVVLSNYNRVCGDEQKLEYLFQRPEKLDPELKIWEAARATSAAPTYFRNFTHEPSKQVYLDGGLYHNNPVAIGDCERKLLWPDVAHLLPDILLSVGSGCNPAMKTVKSTGRPRLGMVSSCKNLCRIAVNHIESSLDSERAWNKYLEVLAPPDAQRYRFRRLNVRLDGEPPKLDDVDAMKELQDTVRKQFRKTRRIRDVARHLIASSFFFEKEKFSPGDGGEASICTGFVQCRFAPRGQYTRDLGRILQESLSESHSPYFVVQELYRETEAQQVIVSEDVIEHMIRQGSFMMGQLKIPISSSFSTITISLSLDGHDATPISGFPRELGHEDSPRVIRSSLGGSSNRLRTPSQLHRRGTWSGPKPTTATEADRDEDAISHYSSPNYLVGDTTPEALRYMHQRLSTAAVEAPTKEVFEMDDTSTPVELSGSEVRADT